jgi:hypothetical protein
MATYMRAQVSIPMDTGMPEDQIINVWHFDSDQTWDEDADDVVGRLRTFYQTIDGSVFPPRVGAAATVKMYDMSDPEPRVPRIVDTIALTPGASSETNPNECAIAISMKATPVSGKSPARLRGRVFIGPIGGGCFAVSGGRVRVTTAVMTLLRDAAVALAKGPDDGDARLAVFSPTTYRELGGGPGALNESFEDVTTIWVDNAPDVIRSRGEDPDARMSTTFT